MIEAIRSAWRHTLPVMAGYVFLGVTFGFLLKAEGFPVWYPVLMSVVIYSGALEFAAIPLLNAPFDPLGSFVMGLMISARHLFYGIPMLKKYEDAGALKFPLIYTLTDETFSVSAALAPPAGVEKKYFYAAISLLDYSYWVAGTTVGALCGELIRFDTTGIDFALTALFIVLFLEQTKTREGRISGGIGLVSSALVLTLFGSEKMVLLSMAVILAVLLAAKGRISHE